MDFAKGYNSVRHSAAWVRSSHMSCCRIAGPDAFALVDRICPADLFIRDGQILHTLLLDGEASILADVYVCREEDDFLLVSETAEGAVVPALATEMIEPGDEVSVEDLRGSHCVVSIHGPYAWEALGELLGPDVISLPYMSFFRDQETICLRAGKTGEYGYDIVVPSGEVESWESRIQALADRLEVGEADLAVLDQCALENWFFNIRREGSHGLTPLELQLQWRLSRRRTFVGSEALVGLRSRGLESRIVAVAAADQLVDGAEVFLDDRGIGRLVNAGRSPLMEEWIGLALIGTEVSHPGIDTFTVESGRGQVPLRSVTPPVLNNRSIFVSPQIHSYCTRGEFEFPSLVKEGP